jgi:hypothetical protein
MLPTTLGLFAVLFAAWLIRERRVNRSLRMSNRALSQSILHCAIRDNQRITALLFDVAELRSKLSRFHRPHAANGKFTSQPN